MDPMLELATKFLEAERHERRWEPKFPQDIDDQIRNEIRKLYPLTNAEEASNNCHPLQEILWELRDERATEILANVFYAKPDLAKRLCEINPDLCPGFIQYLVDEARREWRAGKARTDWPPKRDLLDLLMKHGYDAEETFPTGLRLYLLARPRLVEDLADQLKVALPFSLVLRKELGEICGSRKKRLVPDSNASAAKHLNRIYGINTSLDRLKAFGNDSRLVKQQEHEERKSRGRMWAESQQGREPSYEEGLPPDPVHVQGYPPTQAEKMCLFGLALSGGGIRSATFNLGILQGMADLDLLRRVDYLSGVSGGSHIAGWLAAWIKREHEGVRRLQRWLSPLRSPTPDTEETHPIQFLRRFSNYLAPRKGFLSADAWSMFAVWLRNTILNQIVLVLLLASLLCVPKLIFGVLSQSAVIPQSAVAPQSAVLTKSDVPLLSRLFSPSAAFSQPSWFSSHDEAWISALSILLITLLAVTTGLNVRSFDHGDRRTLRQRKWRTPQWNQVGVISTVVFGTWLLGLLSACLLVSKAFLHPAPSPRVLYLVIYLVIFGNLLLAQFLARTWQSFFSDRLEEETTKKDKAKAIGWTILFSAVSCFIGLSALRVGFLYYEKLHRSQHALTFEHSRELLNGSFVHTIVFGPSVIVGLLALVMILQIGLMGKNLPDTRREWWSRFGATLLIALCGWTALAACSLYGPRWVQLLKENGKLPWPLFLWLAVTAIGSRWGFGAQTAAFPVEQESRSPKYWERLTSLAPREWIARVAPYFFIAGLAIALSFLLYDLTAYIKLKSVPGSDHYWDSLASLPPPWWLVPAMLALAMLLAWRFDVNEFSMHHFYRNRLVRCYLGASRAAGKRNPNPFTGFDPDDDLRIADLRLKPPDLLRSVEHYYGPFLIINTTLNLVAGKELAWQERKAASFAFTPLYCGYELATGAEYTKRNFANYGYRPTTDYSEPRFDGPSLGTAFTISGAALNPNMGYHSSPALSFLMALFNVRLGSWLGNTRHSTEWRKSSPNIGLPYLINELLGNTSDTSRFINLSDGGHFENLGLYELVRRRCMFIIVSDAEEDPIFSFGGLGNAIRKCRTDFGVDIRLDPDQLRPVAGAGRSRTHCATGEIIYSPDARGILLYIKTSLSGDEPADVLEYKLRHSAFPHQSTLNPFFDESQFESYRALGKHIAMAILKRASQSSSKDVSEQSDKEVTGKVAAFWRRKSSNGVKPDLDKMLIAKMFHYLHAMWYPATKNIVALSEQHSQLYADLVNKFESGGKDLSAAARTFFRASQKPRRLGSAFYAHALMIELMYRVFLDLELETMADHPHNEGWMHIFRDWAKSREFKKTWNLVQGNYDVRFRTFCNKEFIQDETRPQRKGFPWFGRAA